MTFENNFIDHSKQYIFLDNEILLRQWEETFKKIFHKNYDKKNNESLKNITISDLSKFDYFYKPEKEESKISLIDNFNYDISVVNGKCKNYEDDNIEIRNFTNLDFKSFLNQDNNNLDDIIIDFNKIFLNTGIFFNVKNNSKINIRLIHNTSDNFTIFQKNNRSQFDVIIGMYHDQVLAPIKTLFEFDAINITLGLPFYRISPDHGPNEKMSGMNLSEPLSLIRAIEFLDINWLKQKKV